jgi:DivIVA domain-containing protein
MILIVLLSVVLGGLLVWALYAEPTPPRPRPVPTPIGVWSVGADLRRHSFPVVLAGYDPAAVDAHLARIAEVHDELRRAAAGPPGPPAPPAPPPPDAPPPSVLDG